MADNFISVANGKDFDAQLKKAQVVIVHFWADWSAPCKQMDAVLLELAKSYADALFLKVEAEEVEEISEKYQVTAVPLFLFFKAGELLDRLEGADPVQLTARVRGLLGALPDTKSNQAAPPKMDINDRIKSILASAKVMLFMKGSPDAPRCGFSGKVTRALQDVGVQFKHFDILQDEEVRQGLKKFSNWPTYPQLYVQGELLGGCDIIMEMKESGELKSAIDEQMGEGAEQPEALNSKLKRLVQSAKVMLFMKGSPDAPRCGFSSKVVEMLQSSGVDFGHFDILKDEAVRQGLKEYSQWPTYPQLYVGGELLGGCDIITELHQGGELKSSINDTLANTA